MNEEEKDVHLKILCRKCGSARWVRSSSNEDILDYKKQEIEISQDTFIEYRCVNCGKKASVEEHAAITTSPLIANSESTLEDEEIIDDLLVDGAPVVAVLFEDKE